MRRGRLLWALLAFLFQAHLFLGHPLSSLIDSTHDEDGRQAANVKGTDNRASDLVALSNHPRTQSEGNKRNGEAEPKAHVCTLMATLNHDLFESPPMRGLFLCHCEDAICGAWQASIVSLENTRRR